MGNLSVAELKSYEYATLNLDILSIALLTDIVWSKVPSFGIALRIEKRALCSGCRTV